MSRQIHSRPSGRTLRVTTRVLAACAAALACCKSPGGEEPPPGAELRLRSRTLVHGEGLDRDLRVVLADALQRGETRHVMVRVATPLDAVQRADLEEAGVRLLGYLGSDTWFAAVTDARALGFADAGVVAADPALAPVRWMGEILPADKVDPRLRAGGAGATARTPDGDAALVVYHFEDADPEAFAALLVERGARVVASLPSVHALQVTASGAAIDLLAAEEAVRWIEEIPPRGRPEAARARAYVQVDDADAAGLEGGGIVVAVLEDDHASISHGDLTGHVFVGDGDPYSRAYHPTATAGLIAGNGTGGSQYTGMAPQATVFSYDFWVGTDPDETTWFANYLSDLRNAVDVRGASVLCNSWGTYGCDPYPYGEYSGLCDDLDAAVRGDGYERPAVVVFSAGNERDGYWNGTADSTDCITDTAAPFANYRTINHPKAAKNTLVVGGVDSANDRMSAYSSWGPSLDGRIKPELVAGGHHNGVNTANVSSITDASQAYQTTLYNPDYPTYDYGSYAMTSAAAAAASGAVALLVEDYRATMRTPIDPLPSTVKALLIQTALDLSDPTSWFNPGPDFASGFGRLQVKDAIDLIGTGRHLEAKVIQGEEHAYTVDVAAGATSLKVTLAWDDPAAQPNVVDTLVHDLDLRVVDPVGTSYYPWRLDGADPSAAAVRTAGADRVNNVEQVLVDPGLTGGGALPSGTWTILVTGTTVPNGPQRYSLVADRPLAGAIDAIAVLDRSGSMGGEASPGMPDTKIEVLREAVSLFVDVMKADVGNRLGLVQFNSNVVPLASPPDPDLAPLTGARRTELKTVTIPSIMQGGLTSIGDGLRAALNQFPAPAAGPATPRSILLVTDGQENQPEWIADVRQDLVDAGVGVYSLGLGYGSGVDEEKLTELSGATGATYRITSDHMVFRKLFLEALGGAAEWSLVVDPIGMIGPGQTQTIPVQVARDEHVVTFAAYWEGVDDAIALQLVTPSGRALQPKWPVRGVRYGADRHYAFFQLDLPLGGSFAGEWEGTWQMRLTGTARIGDDAQVRYSGSALAEGGVRFEAGFDRPVYATGGRVALRASLKRAGRPVPGAKVRAYGDVPAAAIGTLLSDPKLDAGDPDTTADGDPLSLAQRKLRALLDAHGGKALPRRGLTVDLFDDGQHGDGAANDGVYGADFADTKIPGSYTFRFVAEGIPAGGRLTTTREWTGSFYNRVRVERRFSDCSVRTLSRTLDGRSYTVAVTPRDAFGNLLGPGHTVAVAVAEGRSRREVELADRGDGSYGGKVLVTAAELTGDPKLDVLIDGEALTRFGIPGRRGGSR